MASIDRSPQHAQAATMAGRTKPVTKPASKPASKPPVRRAAKATAPTQAPTPPAAMPKMPTPAKLPTPMRAKATKADKPAKTRPRLVRDSFTMPDQDFKLIGTLKARALDAKRPAKKSELLRAGLHVLEGLGAAALITALDRLMPLKAGRPKKAR
jgi:hypothetical protein